MGEVIDKTKGKIKQAVGNLTGNKRLKRKGERDERKAKSKRGEGYEARGQRKNSKLTQMFNKVKGGNYHEHYNAHHSHRRVDPIVRRGWRLLLEETTVGATSHIILT